MKIVNLRKFCAIWWRILNILALTFKKFISFSILWKKFLFCSSKFIDLWVTHKIIVKGHENFFCLANSSVSWMKRRKKNYKKFWNNLIKLFYGKYDKKNFSSWWKFINRIRHLDKIVNYAKIDKKEAKNNFLLLKKSWVSIQI